MRMSLLLLWSMLCSVTSFASCNGAKEKGGKYEVRPDSGVYYMLGKTMSDIMFSPTKVTCYTILGKSKVSKEDYELEPHYVRDSLIAKLTSNQITLLQFNLLSDEENYKEDSIKVKSPYVPCIEICFEKKSCHCIGNFSISLLVNLIEDHHSFTLMMSSAIKFYLLQQQIVLSW